MAEGIGYNNGIATAQPIQNPKIKENNPVNTSQRVDPAKATQLQRNEVQRQRTGLTTEGDPSVKSRGSLGQPRVLAEIDEFEIQGGPGGRESGGARAPLGSGGPIAGGPGGPGQLGNSPVDAPDATKPNREKSGFQEIIEDNVPADLKEENVIDVDRFRERIQRSVDTLNQRMEELGRSVRFSRDKEFDREVITVVNPESGDLIRQIPPEYAIRVSEGLRSMRGMLFDDKA